MYILILFAHVGMMGDGNSNSLAIVQRPFISQAACETAGKKAEKLSSGSTKIVKYTCVYTDNKDAGF